jgi:hypothetical protein
MAHENRDTIATTTNFLSPVNALKAHDSDGHSIGADVYATDWQVSSANGSFVVDDSEAASLTPAYYGLRISPTNTDPVVLDLGNISVLGTDAFRTSLAFSTNIFSDALTSIKCEISQQGETPGGVSFPLGDPTHASYNPDLAPHYPDYDSSRSSPNIPGVWTAARSNYYPIAKNASQLGTSDYTMRVRVTVSGHLGNSFYATTFAVTDDNAFNANALVKYGRAVIPTFYWDMDAAETNPTYPFYKLLDVLTAKSNQVLSELVEWFDYELIELRARDTGLEGWTRSTLVDPKYVNPNFTGWLSQFLGSGTKADVWVAGVNQNAAGGAATGVVEAWIPDYDAFMEWQFENGYYGVHSGTGAAVVGAVQQVLSGDKRVGVSPNATVHEGTSQASGTLTVELETSASSVDDTYSNHYIYIVGGTGAGQSSPVASYVGSTRVATLSDAFSFAIDTTSIYKVTSPWVILLQTLIAETPDAAGAGDSSAPVLGAAELARPMGYSYMHEAAVDLYLTLNNVGIGQLNQFALG